jgi:hypothetical protein
MATLVAACSIWTGWRDRGQLTLRLHMQRFTQDPVTGELIEAALDSLEGCELRLTVVNRGRRAITPVTWYGVPHSWSTAHVLLHEFIRPQPISETQPTCMVYRDVQALVAGFRRMYVLDSCGRRWYVRRKHLRSITKQVEALRMADARLAGDP